MSHRIFEELLAARGLGDANLCEAFLLPSYDVSRHDPFLLPDMVKAVERLVKAGQAGELVYIYGDYDIDGLSATTILLDAFTKFGLKVKTFIPNRFVDGYGISEAAVKTLAADGAGLIVTVDCGSLSHAEIAFAGQLGVDVIVTDHHSVGETMPPAVATINPKRTDHNYPFIDLAGCGVAFKLVQALQQRLDGLPSGQEKWLLDLVALGTVCDVVSLTDENRTNVHWGLKVLAKTRRPGIKALAAVAGLEPANLSARSLGFIVGPHLNAAGRLETAQLSLDLLTATDPLVALGIAERLHEMNLARRTEQDRIFKEASLLAQQFINDPVLVLSDASWSHGIIGIVAAKLLESFQKPAFVLQEMGEESKGSARSYGDFSAVAGIRAVEQWLTKGGGHKLAAGVTLPTAHIPHFRQAINDFYRSLALQDQQRHLEPTVDVVITALAELDFELLRLLKQLEPYGHGNPEPTFLLKGMWVRERQEMGDAKQHLKLHLADAHGGRLAVIGFGQSRRVEAQPGEMIDAWVQLTENEWRSRKSVEGRLLKAALKSG
jgi:single-stranded-DNA-specific exonuclease